MRQSLLTAIMIIVVGKYFFIIIYCDLQLNGWFDFQVVHHLNYNNNNSNNTANSNEVIDSYDSYTIAMTYEQT